MFTLLINWYQSILDSVYKNIQIYDAGYAVWKANVKVIEEIATKVIKLFFIMLFVVVVVQKSRYRVHWFSQILRRSFNFTKIIALNNFSFQGLFMENCTREKKYSKPFMNIIKTQCTLKFEHKKYFSD